MRFPIILAALALTPVASALAADPAPTQAAALATAPATAHTSNLDPNAIVCKREDVTASRLGGAKICHTRKEWAEREATARDAVNDLENRANLVRPAAH